jgi:hypothetical protein
MNEQVIDAFRRACNDLAEAINKQLFEGSRDYYWVADNVGGTCDFGDEDFINPDDMVRILKAGMTYDEYAEWRNANVDHQQYINLSSWLQGLRHNMLTSRKGNKK